MTLRVIEFFPWCWQNFMLTSKKMNVLMEEFLGSIKLAFSSVFLNEDEMEGEELTVEEMNWHRFYRKVYCKQLHDWDCGLACCAMVLNWCKKDSFAVYDHELAKRTTPLWTIELFFFLRQEGVQASMYTLSLGLQAHHHDIDWYSKMNSDEAHVDALFHQASEQSLPVQLRSFSTEDLQSLLSDETRVIAILLVDSLTIHKKRTTEEYAGHYIVVLKYDVWTDEFIYLNPAGPTGIQRLGSKLFESARKHIGTDEDIILCQHT